MTRCWISTGSEDIDTTTDIKLAVVAEVSQGSKPVVGAKVEASVDAILRVVYSIPDISCSVFL